MIIMRHPPRTLWTGDPSLRFEKYQKEGTRLAILGYWCLSDLIIFGLVDFNL